MVGHNGAIEEELRELICKGRSVEDIAADLQQAKDSVGNFFDIRIQILGDRIKLSDNLALLHAREATLEKDISEQNSLERQLEQLTVNCTQAEQDRRSVYEQSSVESEITDKNFKVVQLRAANEKQEKVIKNQIDNIAKLKVEMDTHLPLIVHGSNIRNRVLEGLRLKENQEKAVLELSNASAHQGSAVSEALLYSPDCPNKRTDVDHYKQVYGFPPAVVLRNQNFQNVMQMLDWRGGYHVLIRKGSVGFKDTDFYECFKGILMRVGKGKGLAEVESFITEDESDEVGNELFEDLRREFNNALAARRLSPRNR